MIIRIGCQAYTWQMSFDKYAGKIPHLLSIAQQAGFVGFEPEVCMLGSYYSDPQFLKQELDARGMQLAAFCLSMTWREKEEKQEERAEVDCLLKYMESFPETVLMFGHVPGSDRTSLYERQKRAIACMNAAAKRAADKGITAVFHPNSPAGSVFRTAEDYEVLFNGMDRDFIGYCPDSGHITNGGMDAVEIFRKARPIIKHVHFKDISPDGKWAAMGDGIIDHETIVKELKESNYCGWIMVEEESDLAEKDPDGVTLYNGRYVCERLLPILEA